MLVVLFSWVIFLIYIGYMLGVGLSVFCVINFIGGIFLGILFNFYGMEKFCLNRKGCDLKCLFLGGDCLSFRKSWIVFFGFERKG